MNTTSYTSIAVVGASVDPNKYGYKVYCDLLEAGFSVYPVNPKGGTILGQHVYPTLSQLPLVPDLVITVVPPSITEQIIDECHALNIKAIWMQPGSESKTALQKAQDFRIAVTSKACFMKQQGIWK